jgi:glutamyl-tRNA synthetase
MNDVNKTPRVRIAPSPTGELHLGGARTALFNWLFAKHHGGTFLLRIEDTDPARSKPEYVQQIEESLTWLGLNWDEPEILQSQRSDKYKTALKALLNSEYAYRCFCTKNELDADRQSAEKSGEPYFYSGKCRNLPVSQIQEKLKRGRPFSIRMRIPDGTTGFTDSVYGYIHVENKEIDDFIIGRNDGSATYNLVVVVDDNEMQITHVIRGEDHISNTPKQILIYKALGMEVPQFTHLPMILGPDKKRLSKRHGAPGIQFFRDQGYLPDALINYLTFLGWNPGTEQEIYSVSEIIKSFSIDRIQKKGAVYDENKLNWMSGQHLMRLDPAGILEKMRAFNTNWHTDQDDDYLHSVIALMKKRIKSLVELDEKTEYFFTDPQDFEEKAANKHWKNRTVNYIVESYMLLLNNLSKWNKVILEDTLRSVCDKTKVPSGKLIHATRLAVSGGSAGPSLFEMLEVLGKKTCVRRLNYALQRLPL